MFAHARTIVCKVEIACVVCGSQTGKEHILQEQTPSGFDTTLPYQRLAMRAAVAPLVAVNVPLGTFAATPQRPLPICM